MPTLFRKTYPTPRRDYFKVDDLIDLEPTPEGFDIEANSLEMIFTLSVYSGITSYTQNPADSGGSLLSNGTGALDVAIDPYAGAHSFFKSFDCITQQGVLENIGNYPRLVRSVVETKSFNDDMLTQSDLAAAGITGENNFGQRIITRLTDTTGGVQFAIKPFIAFNSTNRSIPFDKVGFMRIRTVLAPVAECLFGADCSSSIGYWISDLRLEYKVVPSTMSKEPIYYQVFKDIAYSTNSSNVNISSLMPGLANSAIVSFLLTSQEGSYTVNTLKSAALPAVTRVTYSFNGADNIRVTYPIENSEERLLLAKRALASDGLSSMRLSRQQRKTTESEGYYLGILFGQPLDLTRSKFELNILSDTTNGVNNSTNKYTAYVYFRGMGVLA